MKRRNKLIAAIIAINMVTAMGTSAIAANAEANYTSAETLVNTAISESNFYYYNMAYAEILKLSDGEEKEALLGKLSTIGSKVWTKDITEIVQMFEVMAKEKSGRKYDELQVRIGKSSINEIDKQYLYSELYSWGTNTVWTDEYKKAVAAIIKVWNEKTEIAALEAEKAIADMTLVGNMEYLTELLTEAKIAAGLVVSLDGKYFDVAANGTYIGTGKSIIIDLSKDTKERTVTLKGTIKDLTINAPLATVILENAEVNQINLLDVSGNSLHLRGTTKVKNLIVNDKNDNARVVLQGKATVASAEVKSSAKIEVNVDSEVKNPFERLQLNTGLKKVVELLGDFRSSVVQVQKPAELKVAAKLEKLEVAKEAKDTQVNIAKDGKIQEIKAEAAVKVEGQGTVGSVTGSAKDAVVNNTTPTTPPVSGGGGGYSMYTPGEPNVTANDKTNRVEGITTAMEYSLDGGTTYKSYVADEDLYISGAQTVKVRVKAVAGVNYAGTPKTLTFTANAYTVRVAAIDKNTQQGTAVSKVGIEDLTISQLYDAYIVKLDPQGQLGTSNYEKLKTRIDAVITELKDVKLAGSNKDVLTHVIDTLKAKNPSSELASLLQDYLNTPNPENIINYLKANKFDSLYAAVVANTNGDIVIPQLSNSQLTIKIGSDIYTTNNTLKLTEIETKLGIKPGTQIGELLTKEFDIEVSYGSKTYKANAKDGKLTVETYSNIYEISVTTP